MRTPRAYAHATAVGRPALRACPQNTRVVAPCMNVRVPPPAARRAPRVPVAAEVCHGIPSASRVLRAGDLVNIDVTVTRSQLQGESFFIFCPKTKQY